MIHHGDCAEVLKTLPDNSVDSIVTDPPYGLRFMNKHWDADVPSVDIWRECLRVLKPGGHLLSFAGTRTQHRMAVAIEDAGFEIRDMIAWVYGSGFPKALDISKAIDKAAGAEREVVGVSPNDRPKSQVKGGKAFDRAMDHGQEHATLQITAPATPEAQQWAGWGTALKPALEPITMARKPLSEGTVAANVLQHGTGALNVDGCRVETTDSYCYPNGPGGKSHHYSSKKRSIEVRPNPTESNPLGRWPANLIHDGSDEVTELLGQAARFFYCPKASRRERGKGNNHATVKPIDLMRYLCRLVTPPGGVVLDPFMGSGSTGIAAKMEGFRFIGIEREAEYVEIAIARIAGALSL